MSVNRKIGLKRALDVMRAKQARLVKTHDSLGSWVHYLSKGEYVEPVIAEKIKEHPQVVAGGDGIWPGADQSWEF
jgi:hypothetical protein